MKNIQNIGFFTNGSSTNTTTNSVTLTPSTGPYPSNTLWINSTNNHIYHGSRDTENNDPTQIYVTMNGDTLANGANGFINSPLSTISEALSLYPVDKSGLTVIVHGQFTLGTIHLNPNATINCHSPSPMCVIGALDINTPEWLTPSPYFFNQSELNNIVCTGLIDLGFTGYNNPLFLFNDCSILGGVICNGPGELVFKDCIVTSSVQIIDTNTNFTNCNFALLGQVGTLQISHLIAQDMVVVISNTTIGGTVTINHSSPTNTLTIYMLGNCNFTTINVNSVGFTGGVVLILDDTPDITFGFGTQADTIVNYIKKSQQVTYTPANPLNWSPVPDLVNVALDQLAATGTGTGDVVGPASATDTALCRFDGTTGKLIQNSNWTLDSSGNVNLSGTKYVTRPNTTSLCVGTLAGNALAIGDVANLAIGPNALQVANSCSNNCAVGSLAGQSVTTGSNNTLIGISSGINISTGGANIMVGNGSGLSCSTANNQIAIGNTGSNTSDTIYIGTAQTQCLVAGIYPATGDGVNFVTCDSTGKLGNNKLPITIFGNAGTGTTWNGAVTRYAFIGGGTANQFNAFALTLTYNLDITKLTCYTYSSLGSAGTLTYNILKNGSPVGSPVVSTCSLSTIVSVSGAQSISFVIGDTIVLKIDGNASMSTTSLQSVYWELDGFRY